MSELQQDEITEAKALEALEASLGTEAEAWRPEPGEILSGTIVSIDMRASEYGPYPGVTVKPLGGEPVVFHAFRTVAKNELKRLKPSVGDMIAVAYLGAAKGTDYHGYKIRVSREVGDDFDWDAVKEDKRPVVEG